MIDTEHTIGAGGLVSNIVSTNGQRFLVPVKAKNDVWVANLVRRIIVEFDNDDDHIDKQLALNDIAFLIRSLINYFDKDVELIDELGLAGGFTSDEGEKPLEMMVRDLRLSAEKLMNAVVRIENSKIAIVDPPVDSEADDE